jgi:hypothetical protein
MRKTKKQQDSCDEPRVNYSLDITAEQLYEMERASIKLSEEFDRILDRTTLYREIEYVLHNDKERPLELVVRYQVEDLVKDLKNLELEVKECQARNSEH